MAISEGYKRIGPAWASTTTEDNRDDPTDTDLTPTLALGTGWDNTFSTTNQPRRKVLNELLYRHDSALLDIRNFGILPWDAAVDTLAGGIKQRKGVIQAALVDNGPSYGNPTDPDTPGQTVWSALRSGDNNARLPAPADLMSTPLTYRRLKFQWDLITVVDGRPPPSEYQLRWKQKGKMEWNTESVFGTSVTVEVPNKVYDIIAQARGVSTAGYGDWTAEYTRPKEGIIIGSGTGAPDAPLGLRGLPRYDRLIRWNWNTPVEPALRFELQTKQGGNWPSGNTGVQQVARMQTNTRHSTTANVQGRLRVVTQGGTSPWSAEVEITGMLRAKVPPKPANQTFYARKPDHVKLVADIPPPYSSEFPVVTSYNFEFYNAVGRNIQGTHPNPEAEVIITKRNEDLVAFLRATNSMGMSSRDASSYRKSNFPVQLPAHPDIANKVFNASEKWSWPHEDDNAHRCWMFTQTLNEWPNTTSQVGSAVNTGQFIDLGAGAWLGCFVSDHDGGTDFADPTPATTIYFVDDVTNTAKAYNINTGERITGQDINLGVGDWKGGCREGNRLFFLDNFNNKLAAYNPATRRHTPTFDVNLGNGDWKGVASVRQYAPLTGWYRVVLDGNAGKVWVNGVRDTSKDIAASSLGGGTITNVTFGGRTTGTAGNHAIIHFLRRKQGAETGAPAKLLAWSMNENVRKSNYDVTLADDNITAACDQTGYYANNPWVVDDSNDRAWLYAPTPYVKAIVDTPAVEVSPSAILSPIVTEVANLTADSDFDIRIPYRWSESDGSKQMLGRVTVYPRF